MPRNDKLKTLKHTAMASAIAVAILASPLAATAAGMGKINVLSALGEPLRAELDITATREEAASLSARVAPPDAFRQANLEYTGVLTTLRFSLERRADGRPYFKITSDRPINDPFIDMLVELSWSSGRLVREYAFLLDPPEVKAANAASSVAAAPAAPAVPPIAAPVKPTEVPAADVVVPKRKHETPPAAKETAAAGTVEVKPGDTLSKIARENIVEGVTLNQMLVALYNNNRDAFIGNNMNRLKAGKILNVPDAAAAAAVAPGEAGKIVVAQWSEFNSYRNALAGAAEQQAPASEQTARSSTGKIVPKVEEPAPAEPGKDKLQVSRSAEGTSGKLSEEDRIAREKALKEANTRVAELEKNLTDLKRLAEMKSQGAGATPAVPPAEGGNVSGTPPLPAPAAPVVPAESVSGTTPAPVPEMPPQKKAKPPMPAKVALPEPSFIDENPALVYGGGAAIVALLGWLGLRVWKRRQEGFTANESAVTLNEPATSASVDRATGPSSNFSHSTLDAIDTGKSGVDPIQEAEVYMAYGRDIQAEEILRDALAKDSDNLAIVGKLLEIYAARKSVAQFNELAGVLHGRTGGSGEAWNKAAELGRGVDPENPLYGGAVATGVEPENVAAIDDVADATDSLLEVPAVKEEVPEIIDFDLDAPAEQAEQRDAGGLDFDLDLGEPASAEQHAAGDLDIDLEAPPTPDNVIDFDLGESDETSLAQSSAPPLDLSDINLDLDTPATSPAGDSSEVASKLELAQAYEEMGDREGARELLEEVIAEGSPAQQEAARKKLAELA